MGKLISEGGFQAREGRGLYAPRKPPSLQVGYWGGRGSGDGHACPSHPLQRLGPDTSRSSTPLRLLRDAAPAVRVAGQTEMPRDAQTSGGRRRSNRKALRRNGHWPVRLEPWLPRQKEGTPWSKDQASGGSGLTRSVRPEASWRSRPSPAALEDGKLARLEATPRSRKHRLLDRPPLGESLLNRLERNSSDSMIGHENPTGEPSQQDGSDSTSIGSSKGRGSSAGRVHADVPRVQQAEADGPMVAGSRRNDDESGTAVRHDRAVAVTHARASTVQRATFPRTIGQLMIDAWACFQVPLASPGVARPGPRQGRRLMLRASVRPLFGWEGIRTWVATFRRGVCLPMHLVEFSRSRW